MARILDNARKKAHRKKRKVVAKVKDLTVRETAEHLDHILDHLDLATHAYIAGVGAAQALYDSFVGENPTIRPLIDVVAKWLRGEIVRLAEKVADETQEG